MCVYVIDDYCCLPIHFLCCTIIGSTLQCKKCLGATVVMILHCINKIEDEDVLLMLEVRKHMGYRSKSPHQVPLLSAKTRKLRPQFPWSQKDSGTEDWKNVCMYDVGDIF